MAELRKVVVIGGGVIGLSCAWRIALAGARVELLEARTPGEGATRAALGALWPASPLANGALQQMHRASLWEFEGFVGELAQRAGLAVGFKRLGRVELLNSEKAAARAVEEAAAACAGWPALGGELPVMEVMDAGALARRWPQVARTEYPALLCRATAQVVVPELMGALTAACVAAGVVVRTHVKVTRLEMSGGRVKGVRTGEGLMEADAVLVAAGAWTGQLAPEIAKVAPVRPAKGQGLALQMPHGVRVETIIKSEKIYLIPWEEAGEVLVGSTTEPEAGFDEMPTAEGRETLLAGAGGIMAGLRHAIVLRHWAGLRPQNPAKRHPPIMGPVPGVAGLYVCAGHFKTGIGLAPRVSRLMCETMMTGVVAGELEAFVPRG